MSDEVLDAMIRGLPPEKLEILKHRVDAYIAGSKIPVEKLQDLADRMNEQISDDACCATVGNSPVDEDVLETVAYLAYLEDKATLVVTKETFEFQFDNDEDRDTFIRTFLDLMREIRKSKYPMRYPEP